MKRTNLHCEHLLDRFWHVLQPVAADVKLAQMLKLLHLFRQILTEPYADSDVTHISIHWV
jgi:hypothetical protein